MTEQSSKGEPIYADRLTGESFSDARSMVSKYLETLAEEYELPMLTLDRSGHAEIRLGGASIGINVLERQGVLMIFAPVKRVPSTPPEAFYRRLLEASFVSTQDAGFAIDASRSDVVLRTLRRLSALDYEEFEDLIVTVGNMANFWGDQLDLEFGS